MGRSQVLYNRTKGRYRQRNGAPGRGLTGNPQRVANESPHEDTPPPQAALNTVKSRRPKIDESILLAEPTTMYVTHQEGADDDIVFASGGMIDIANLAATLTSCMSLAQQLRIPSHVAYQLENPNSTLELKTVKSKNEMSVDLSNDDASFSVAHTRLRVDADGQVEARPKPGLYNPLLLVESIKEDEYIEDPSRHQYTQEQSPARGGLALVHSDTQETTTFDGSVEPHSRRIRHGKDFDEDDDEVESHGRDRYMALIESNLDDSDEFYGETPLDQPPPTSTTTTNKTFPLGYAPSSSRPEAPAAYSVPKAQSPRSTPQSSIEKVAKRQPKVETSIGNIKRTPAAAQPTVPTPKHSKNKQENTSQSNGPKDSESYLEDWLEEALQSQELPLPIHQIAVRPVADHHDDYSSITDLPHQGGSSISSITFSKVGARTTDKTQYYTRNRPYNDDERRFSTLDGITSSGSSVGGSTMDSRGQMYEDEGCVQPITVARKHQPSPHGKTKSSSSKTTAEAGGEDLDAWLDSVIA